MKKILLILVAACFVNAVYAQRVQNAGLLLGTDIREADISELFFPTDTFGAAYGYYDDSSVFFRGGVFSPVLKPQIGINFCLKYSPTKHISITGLSSYVWNIQPQGLTPVGMYSGVILSSRLFAGNDFIASPYLTAEYNGREDFSCIDTLYRAGLTLKSEEPRLSRMDFTVNSYFFAYSQGFMTMAAGLGTAAELTMYAFKAIGFTAFFSTRYAAYNNGDGIYVYNYDGYKGILPEKAGNFILSSGLEAFFYSRENAFGIKDLFSISRIKAGMLVNTVYVQKPHVCTGLFCRIEVSFIGMNSIIIDTAIGWDYAAKNVFLKFSFISKW